MSLPGTLLPWLNGQFTDDDGVVLEFGSIKALVTGTATLKDIFTDAELTTPWQNPAPFNPDGRITAYLEPGGYDFIIYSDFNPSTVVVRTIVGVSDPTATFVASLGVELALPVATVVSDGYVVVSTDTLVIVDGTGGPSPCVLNLSTVADHPLPLTIKNIGNVQVQIRPSGTETIENETAYYYLPVAASPVLPSYFMVNDGVSAWFILAALGE